VELADACSAHGHIDSACVCNEISRLGFNTPVELSFAFLLGGQKFECVLGVNPVLFGIHFGRASIDLVFSFLECGRGVRASLSIELATGQKQPIIDRPIAGP
jgi:hypothetical protein